MSDLLVPQNTVTFKLTRTPRRDAQRKTIERLMSMQPETQKTLRELQQLRRREQNHTYIRAGNPWTARVRAARPARAVAGATFTLRLTPQIIPDVRSVEGLLEASKA